MLPINKTIIAQNERIIDGVQRNMRHRTLTAMQLPFAHFKLNILASREECANEWVSPNLSLVRQEFVCTEDFEREVVDRDSTVVFGGQFPF